MKHVNLSPELEKKKEEVMKRFREDGAPDKPVASVTVREPVTVKPAIGTVSSTDPAETAPPDELRERVVEALKTIYDPEIPVNIYDLGLIYRVEIKNGFAEVDMTLTSPGCPVAQTFPGMVEGAVKMVPGVTGAAVELVWDPPWTQTMISEAARLELGLI